MNCPTPTPTQRRVSLLTCCAATVALAVTLVACEKKSDGAAPAGDAPGAVAAVAAATPARPKATRQAAELRSAYAAEFNDNSKMTDPTEKKVAAFVAKVGKADADSGRKLTWNTLDGGKCTKMELDTKDGSITEMTGSNADCGL